MAKNVFMPIGQSLFNMNVLQRDLISAEPSRSGTGLTLVGITEGSGWRCEMEITTPALMNLLNDDLPSKSN